MIDQDQPASSPLLLIEKLSHFFEAPSQGKIELFHDISLQVMKQESLAITGASGEGKSTLLNIIGGLESPISGSQKWEDKAAKPARGELGFIFQQFHLLEDLSVLENVLLPLRLKRSRLKQDEVNEAKKIIEKVGLAGRMDQIAAKLSGGEKQRCAIARALISNPKLILADEPTGNLDHQNASQIADLLFEMVREKGCALILITHDLQLASRCDRVLKLEDAKLISLKN